MTRNAFLIERRLYVLALLASVAHSARAETLRVGQWCDRGNRADPGRPHVDRLAAVAGSGAARWNADKAADKAADKSRVLRFTFSRRQEDPRTQWLIAVYRPWLRIPGCPARSCSVIRAIWASRWVTGAHLPLWAALSRSRPRSRTQQSGGVRGLCHSAPLGGGNSRLGDHPCACLELRVSTRHSRTGGTAPAEGATAERVHRRDD